MIRVVLPHHLRTLAGVSDEVTVDVTGPATLQSVLDALEARYPMLRGTVRDHVTQQRRKLVRFFVCEEDWSDRAPETALPAEIVSGREPLLIIGAMAGG
jgi:molybdopterin converting factor small subunit